MKRKPRGRAAVASFRLPPDVLQALDTLVARMQAEHPGLRVTRADVVRGLILEALGRPPKTP